MDVLTERAFREAPELSQYVFDRLLAWLDDGTESDSERYLEMRRRLVSYFDRRSRPAADELADETLNRVARTLEQYGVIATRPPARYCYIIAKFVLFEDLRRERRHVALDETTIGGDRRSLPIWLRTTRCESSVSTASTGAWNCWSRCSASSSSSTTAIRAGRRSSAAARWPIGWVSR